jgi:hypothetical protein
MLMEEAINAIVDAKLSGVHTHVPFKVVSVDWSKKPPTLVAQPTIKARQILPDGTQKWVDLPQVPDVPIQFPGGGGASLTFPIKAGDEGLLMISTRSTDSYQQSGDGQPPVDLRPHDLSNCYAMMGSRTTPTALDSVSSNSTQLRTDDGQTVIDFKGGGVTMTVGGTSLSISDAGVDGSGGYLKWNGVRIDETHKHIDTMPGSGVSGVPEG